MRLNTEARETITNRASTPGSGILWGSKPAAGLPLVEPEAVPSRTA
jgi:hypothetical protein